TLRGLSQPRPLLPGLALPLHRRGAVRGAWRPAGRDPHRHRDHPGPQPVPRLGARPPRLGGRARHTRPDPPQPPAVLTSARVAGTTAPAPIAPVPSPAEGSRVAR